MPKFIVKGVMSAVEFENAANDFRKAAPGNKAHFGLMALLTHDAAMRKELETAQKARDALREENERLRAAIMEEYNWAIESKKDDHTEWMNGYCAATTAIKRKLAPTESGD